MSNLQGVLGLIVIFAVAVLASNNRRGIRPRTVLVALAFRVLFALAVLKWSVGRDVLDFVSGQVRETEAACTAGRVVVRRAMASTFCSASGVPIGT